MAHPDDTQLKKGADCPRSFPHINLTVFWLVTSKAAPVTFSV